MLWDCGMSILSLIICQPFSCIWRSSSAKILSKSVLCLLLNWYARVTPLLELLLLLLVCSNIVVLVIIITAVWAKKALKMLQSCLIGHSGVPAVPSDTLKKCSNFRKVYLTGNMQHFMLGFLGRYYFLRVTRVAFRVASFSLYISVRSS